MTISASPQFVIFDLFGTLIKYGVMHHPFRVLLKWARENGRKVLTDDARNLMTTNFNVSELAQSMSINAPISLLNQIELEINQELESLELYDDVIATLGKLNELGIPIAICSNLAKPYGQALELIPTHIPYLSCMSYEVGFIKPESEIYQWILDRTAVDASQCLFVGDTLLADYEGPRFVGMQALHLVRGQASQKYQINSLLEVLQYVR